MTNIKKFSQDLGGTDGIKSDIAITTPEYLRYLEANMNIARDKENFGAATSESLAELRNAVSDLNNLALSVFKNERRN